MSARRIGRASIFVSLMLIAAAAAGSGPSGDTAESPSGWMGVLLEGASRAGSGAADAPPAGVGLVGVVEGSPADKAGLRARDRILSVEGAAISSAGELVEQVKKLPPDRWIALSIERDGDERELRLRLASRPRNTAGLEVRKGWIGVEALDLPAKLRRHFGAPEDAGVMIADVLTGSPAEAGGFELGDVVYEVDGSPVRSSGEFAGRVRRGGVGNTLAFTVARDGVEVVLEAVVETFPRP